MTLFELAFIALSIVALAMVSVAVVRIAQGARARARRLLVRLAIGSAAYALLLVLVSIVQEPPPFRLGQPRCFDDWCLTVLAGRRATAPPDLFVVHLRLSSRAKRQPMGEAGMTAELRDSEGRRYLPMVDPTEVAFDRRLQPGESVDTTRRFTVPLDAHGLSLVYRRVGFPIEWLIIGEGGWWQAPAAVHFDDAVR